MAITVKKATAADKNAMQAHPTWGCGVSEFDWYYDAEEVCLILEGEVTVSYDGGSVTINEGDYVVFSQGLSCVWQVTKPIKKHYFFR